jgi:hypothetical protein
MKITINSGSETYAATSRDDSWEMTILYSDWEEAQIFDYYFTSDVFDLAKELLTPNS